MNINKEMVSIPKKALVGISSVIAVSAVLISRHSAGELVLFLLGVGAGVFIGRAFFERK